VCVTGLTVLDTSNDFTGFGKLIILFLVQVGGLGIMTLTTFFTVFFAGGMSYKVRVMMKDLLSEENVNEVRALLMKITFFTITIELIGAFFLYFSLEGSLTNISLEKLFSSIFHSVSAFCNAGFSIYSENLMERSISNNFYIPTIIMLLIVIGGLGFPVLSNLASYRPWRKVIKRQNQRLSTYTKLVLATTFWLILISTFLIFIIEPFSFKSMGVVEKLFHSLFLAITPRTAGFNIVSTELLGPATAIFIIVLMWIGASPGSTGGGIKTTTFSVTALSFLNQIRGRTQTRIFKRQISVESIHRASMVIFASLIALFAGSLILIWIEPDKEPLDLIFEATSALGTVGLSRDVTFHLGTGGKFVLIVLMFTGRIGILTFFLAFFKQGKDPHYLLPKVNITVG
jgi:Trk-type K+ transport system membrane component